MSRRTIDVTLPVVLGAFALLAVTLAITGGLARGEWRAELRRSDRVQIKLRPAEELGHWRAEYTFEIEELEGLERAHFSRSSDPLSFEWRRDAGRLRFEGQSGRRPTGRFSFEPDPEFVRLWNEQGFIGVELRELYRLTIREITTEYVSGLYTLGYRLLEARDIIRLDNNGLALEHIEGMQALGYRPSVDDLIRLSYHGIGPQQVRDFAEVGLTDIPAGDLIRLRAHGIGPDYAREMTDAGHGVERVDDLIRLRAHGVSANWVAELGQTGREISTEELIFLRNHGIEVDYFRGMVDSDWPALSIEEIVRLRTHGMPPRYVVELVELGYRAIGVDGLIRLRAHGVVTEELRGFVGLGYTELRIDELIRLRNHGVTPSYVQELVDAGYSELTVEELIRARTRGTIDIERRKSS